MDLRGSPGPWTPDAALLRFPIGFRHLAGGSLMLDACVAAVRSRLLRRRFSLWRRAAQVEQCRSFARSLEHDLHRHYIDVAQATFDARLHVERESERESPSATRGAPVSPISVGLEEWWNRNGCRFRAQPTGVCAPRSPHRRTAAKPRRRAAAADARADDDEWAVARAVTTAGGCPLPMPAGEVHLGGDALFPRIRALRDWRLADDVPAAPSPPREREQLLTVACLSPPKTTSGSPPSPEPESLQPTRAPTRPRRATRGAERRGRPRGWDVNSRRMSTAAIVARGGEVPMKFAQLAPRPPPPVPPPRWSAREPG